MGVLQLIGEVGSVNETMRSRILSLAGVLAEGNLPTGPQKVRDSYRDIKESGFSVLLNLRSCLSGLDQVLIEELGTTLSVRVSKACFITADVC
jgi:hypothetical protein